MTNINVITILGRTKQPTTGDYMNLKRFFIKNIYAILTVIVLLMLAFFTSQIMIMKSQFTETMKQTNTKLSEELSEAMLTREHQINRLQAGISQDNIRRWEIISAASVISKINPRLSHDIVNQYATYMVDEVARHGNIDLMIWMAQIAQESMFDANAISEVGAVGLGQVMPKTAKWLAGELGLVYKDSIRYDPRISLKMSAYFMSDLLSDNNNRYDLALAHYNGGKQKFSYIYNNKYRNNAEYKSHTADEFNAMIIKYKSSIGFNKKSKRYIELREMYRGKLLTTETREYIPRILNNAKRLKTLYKEPPHKE